MPFHNSSVSVNVVSNRQVGKREEMYVLLERWSQVCVLMPSLINSLIVGIKGEEEGRVKLEKVRFAVFKQRVRGDT